MIIASLSRLVVRIWRATSGAAATTAFIVRDAQALRRQTFARFPGLRDDQ